MSGHPTTPTGPDARNAAQVCDCFGLTGTVTHDPACPNAAQVDGSPECSVCRGSGLDPLGDGQVCEACCVATAATKSGGKIGTRYDWPYDRRDWEWLRRLWKAMRP